MPKARSPLLRQPFAQDSVHGVDGVDQAIRDRGGAAPPSAGSPHNAARIERPYSAAGGHVFAPTVTLVNPGSSVVGNGAFPLPAGFTQSYDSMYAITEA